MFGMNFLGGGSFSSRGFLGFVRTYFGGFRFLPPFNHPRHLKSGVPPPPGGGCVICTCFQCFELFFLFSLNLVAALTVEILTNFVTQLL